MKVGTWSNFALKFFGNFQIVKKKITKLSALSKDARIQNDKIACIFGEGRELFASLERGLHLWRPHGIQAQLHFKIRNFGIRYEIYNIHPDNILYLPDTVRFGARASLVQELPRFPYNHIQCPLQRCKNKKRQNRLHLWSGQGIVCIFGEGLASLETSRNSGSITF